MIRRAAPSRARAAAPDTPLLLILLAAFLLLIAQAGPVSAPPLGPDPTAGPEVAGSQTTDARSAKARSAGMRSLSRSAALDDTSGPGRMAVLARRDSPVLAARALSLATVVVEKHAGADGHVSLAGERFTTGPVRSAGVERPARRPSVGPPARRPGDVLTTGPPVGPVFL